MVINIIHHNEDLLEWTWAAEDELIPRPFFTSIYLIDDILIDTGAPGGQDEFRDFVNSILKSQKINQCLITHTHEDHIGSTHVIKDEFHIPTYASPKAVSLLKQASTYPYAEYRQLFWGTGLQSVNTDPFPKNIHSDSQNYSFIVLPTPGHAPDQVILIECSQEWAFVADAVLPKYKNLFGGTCNIQEDIALIYQSIEEIYKFTEGMDELRIFISGKGVFQGREFLHERLTDIWNLRTQVHELNEKGISEEQILEKIFGGESMTGIMTNGELSRLNMIKSLLKWN